jgi:predicted XRE-type DNA-binding protein
LGFADPETALAKAQLAQCVQRGIAQRRLETRDAAKLIGVSQRRLSALLAGRLTDFSVDQLITLLLALGYDVEVVIRKAPRRAQRGRLRVVVSPRVRRALSDRRRPVTGLCGATTLTMRWTTKTQ